jgi:hypothetical protein
MTYVFSQRMKSPTFFAVALFRSPHLSEASLVCNLLFFLPSVSPVEFACFSLRGGGGGKKEDSKKLLDSSYVFSFYSVYAFQIIDQP